MKPAPFRYADPGSLSEAIAALSEAGEGAKVLAGGQSLIPLLSMRLAAVLPAVRWRARIIDRPGSRPGRVPLLRWSWLSRARPGPAGACLAK